MRAYNIVGSETALVIRRRTARAVCALLLPISFLCLMLVVPLANIFVYHYLVWFSIWLVAFVMLMALPLLFGDGKYLVKKVVVLDKGLDQVLINGRRMCALAEVRGVWLGAYTVPTAKDLPSMAHGLYLETADNRAVEIERSTSAGPTRHDLKEVGSAIADFIQVKSHLS